tara:strand:+ start:763 stop:1488 length:726 start_codon:yes stop_codon:yes gene_type:complete
MMNSVFIIIQSFFAVGGGLFFLAKRKQGLPFKKGWNKFFVYMAVVNLISYSISHNPLFFKIIALIIVSQGFFEICKALLLNKSSKIFAFFTLSVYSLLAFGFIMFSSLPTQIMIWTYLAIFLFDGFSQISGQLVGKKPLAPSISPNKTMEGLFGGLLLSLGSLYFLDHITGFSSFQSLFFGLLICIGALLGDLLASLVKRKCGIKDYGRILPGHGGILDRFDSFLFGGAMMYVLFNLLPIQ